MKVIDKVKQFIKSLNTKISNLLTSLFDEDINVLHNTISIITLILTIGIFIVSVFVVSIGLNSILSKNESKLRYIEEDGIRYIELVDGYIKEELVVETGTILPDLQNYFREDYVLPSSSSIQYFENNNSLDLEQFTYEKDGDYYLKGIRNIDVIIFSDYEYETKLSIIDTTSPTFTLKEVSIAADETIDLNNFIETYEDNSEMTDYQISFKEEYDLTKEGTQDVTLVVCDISNNCNEGTTKLTITPAEQPSTGEKPNTNPSGGSTKPSGGSTKPSGGSTTKPSGGSTKPSGGSTTKPSGGTTKPKIYSFSAKNVISPESRTCTVENNKEYYNYTLVEDFYGTTRSTPYSYVKYSRDSSCNYTIISSRGKQNSSIKYAYSNFTGTTKKLLGEAMYMYNTKDGINKEYGNALNEFLSYTNAARKSAGLNSVELDYHLCMVATMRAIELAYSGIPYKNHTRPDGTKWTTLWDEYGLTIPSGRSENIAYNYANNKLAFEGLMGSESHRKAILTDMYAKMGIGRAEFNNEVFIVQTFST